MPPKRPSEVRHDLQIARAKIIRLIADLEKAGETPWGLGIESEKAAARLQQLISDNIIPRDYRVAVIGRFKVGKSAFVNELLGRRLAGEDTSPETAAVTTFRSGSTVRAKINFIEKSAWDALTEIYEQDPADKDAHRVAAWKRFANRTSSSASGGDNGKSDEKEVLNLEALKDDYVRSGGHSLILDLPAALEVQERRRNENDFRIRIRQFTSGTKPHHCLVKSIDIETPSPILDEGVILIDTPGLDDTQRFRVQLTEEVVQDADAILFLTKSGASYGQSEKDFLLSLLRKRSVQQLIFIVTQVDHTYEQHWRQSRDQDEVPDPISVRIDAERGRIRREIEETLEELGRDNESSAVLRYREQLAAIEIAFTSATSHRDGQRHELVKHPISSDDPGGMKQVQNTLYEVLSTESRLATAKYNLQVGFDNVYRDFLAVVEDRRSIVRNLKNREVAESNLADFREKIQQIGSEFVDKSRADFAVLKASLTAKGTTQKYATENIVLQAESVLGSYETDDAGRHWRTRRGGNWGYMRDFQARVANKIFPRVAEHLDSQTSDFESFVDKFRAHLESLSGQASAVSESLTLGDGLRLDVAGILGSFLTISLSELQEIISGEEDQIVSLLEEFVDENVEEKISTAREKVALIIGSGTTSGQNREVRQFYTDVKTILSTALSDHVMKRFDGFSHHLLMQAETLPDRALSQALAEIDRASANVRVAAEAAIDGQKEVFERAAVKLIAEATEASDAVRATLGNTDRRPSVPPLPSGLPDTDIGICMTSVAISRTESRQSLLSSESQTEVELSVADTETKEGLDLLAELRAKAVECQERFTLTNGSSGWPFTRIFRPELLAGASEGWLIDPYLSAPHQKRNLREFVIALMENAKLKTLNIITGIDEASVRGSDSLFYEEVDQDSYAGVGMRVAVTRDSTIHDRFVVLNNGTVFKLGRGLDIYKPAVGLAAGRPQMRRVRACEIDVFRPLAAEDASRGDVV